MALRRDFPQYQRYLSEKKIAFFQTDRLSEKGLKQLHDGSDWVFSRQNELSGFNQLVFSIRGNIGLFAVVFGGSSEASVSMHMIAILGKSFATVTPKMASHQKAEDNPLAELSNSFICDKAVAGDPDVADFWQEKIRRGIECSDKSTFLANYSDAVICDKAVFGDPDVVDFWEEKKRRGLICKDQGISQKPNAFSQKKSTTISPENSNSELAIERQRRRQLEKELAALKAKQVQHQQSISADSQIPLITIISASSSGPKGKVSGRVTDNTGVGEIRVDGEPVYFDSNGSFTANTYVPEGGVTITIEAFDLAGLSSSISVQLDRAANQATSFNFARLNPLTKLVEANPKALALIIGVADYKETSAAAVYADSDARVFADYAAEKLGVPRQQIKTLVNEGADEKDVLFAAKRWLARGAIAGQSDI